MAKVLVSTRDHRPIRLQPHVRDIRMRYMRALQLGYSPLEAAKLANEGGEIKAIDKPLQRERLAKTVRVPATVNKVTVAGMADLPVSEEPPQPAAVEDIPPNWQELPWPQLRDLADRFAGNKRVRSRQEATSVIERAMAGNQ